MGGAGASLTGFDCAECCPTRHPRSCPVVTFSISTALKAGWNDNKVVPHGMKPFSLAGKTGTHIAMSHSRQPVLENPDSQAHTRQGRPAGQQQPILANPLRNQLLRQLGIPEPPVGEGRPPAPAPNAENRPPPAPPQDGGIPRPATPTPDRQRPDQHQSDRVTERLIRSDRSTRPSPSRASSSARGHHLLPRDRSEAPSASSSAAASPTPQHSSLPDGNPFLTFSQSLPVDLEGFAPSQRTANSVKELPDGRTFKLPRVAATSLGIPPSLIIPATSASSAAPAQGPSNAAIPDGETPFDIPLSRGSPKRPPPSLSSSSPKDRQERMMASGSPRPSLLRRVASAEGQDSLVTSQQRPVLRPHSSSPDAHSRFSSRLFASRPHPLAEDTSDSRSTRETVTTPTIPADLNEEQLRTLGSLTREGLQERLNLLEGARESLEAWQTRLQRALQACDEDIPRDANTHSEDHNLSAPT